MTQPVDIRSPLADTPGGEEVAAAPSWTPPHGDIVHGPLNRALFALAGPAILAKALHAALGLVDVFWVGRLGAAPTAAVTTSFFASWVLASATDLSAIGILAHVARNAGAGDRERAGHAAAQGLLLGTLLGVVLAALAWPGARLLFAGLGTDPEVTRAGIVYLRVFYLAAPLTFAYINCEFILRAAGDTRTPMLVTGGMVLLNAVLDPLLIYGLGPFPRLEVLGAALATLLSQLAAVLLFALLAVRRHPSFPLRVASLRRLDAPLARSMLAIGAPGMAVGVLFSAIYLFMSSIAARLGTRELAVLGLANRCEAITYLTTNGFGAATATMVGQNLGAGRPERSARAAWYSAGWMGLFGLASGALLFVFPRQVLGLFTSDAGVIEVGVPYLRILALTQPMMALEIVFEHAFAGAGDTLPPMLISVPMNLVRVPLVLWVVESLEAGLLGIAWVLTLTAMARGVAATVWFGRGGWKRHELR